MEALKNFVFHEMSPKWLEMGHVRGAIVNFLTLNGDCSCKIVPGHSLSEFFGINETLLISNLYNNSV